MFHEVRSNPVLIIYRSMTACKVHHLDTNGQVYETIHSLPTNVCITDAMNSVAWRSHGYSQK